jgi:Sporulation and spore germination
MKWGRFAILALALVVSACGEQGGGSLESTSNEEECRGRFRTGPRDEGTGTFTYEVWFAGSGGFLSVSKRQTNLEPEAPKVPKLALDSLLAGPSEAEAAAGVFTAVPAGTELLHLDIEDGIAMVDLSSEYEQGSGSWGGIPSPGTGGLHPYAVRDGGDSGLPARRRAGEIIRRAASC